MKSFLLFAACLAFTTAPLCAQNVNTAQHVTLAGLRANAGHGSFPAAAYAADGSLFLLYDQHDGIRVLKLSSDATQLLGETHLGSAGDTPIALALDPAGNLYLTGTSTSNGTLTGTSGTAFPTRADLTTNSFVARLSPDLTLQWLTFLGAGATSSTAVIATADAAFVTGITFSSSLPVTPDGIQQAPALGSSQNGFVERLDSAGQLVYATYLTGAQGLTAPAAIAADAQDIAYVTGYTSSPGFPTLNALVPELLDEDSGFLTAITPQGDGFLYSTYVPGSGITSMMLDHTTSQLVLTGNISPGGFPLATALAPLTSATAYQSLVRIPLDGQSVATSSILLPAATSAVSIAPDGSTWITGSLSNTVPATLFPGASQPLAMMGDSFALHLTPSGTLDQTLRFGGQPIGPLSAATLTSALAPPAISPDSATIAFPGTLALSLPSSLAPSQRFDLPTAQTPSTTLPSTLRDVASACTSGACYLTSGYLTLTQNTTAPTLALSYDDAPNLTLRNLGSSTADALTLTASGPTIATNCTQTLLSSNTCSIALSGSGQGSFTASAANAVTETIPLPANTLAPRGLAVSPAELDFGLVTAADAPAARTFTVTNLSSSAQTFASAQDTSAKVLPYALAQSSTDCPPTGTGQYTLAAGAACHVTLVLTPTTNTAFRTAWKAGPLDVTVTGTTQLAPLSVSISHINFGTQITGETKLPRYLFISNNSSVATAHAVVALPPGSPFSVADECPTTLLPHSICRLTLHYASPTAPSSDAITLALDQNISVAVTGNTLPAQAATGASANPSISISPATITFPTPVVVTGVSGPQSVTVHNTSAVAQPISIISTTDFHITNGCPATLAGNATCTVQVAFAPSQPGIRPGLLSIASGTNFSPAYVSLSGTATALLPPNNGTLALGQTLTGEPLVVWYKVQQPLSTLTASTNSPDFAVALVEDTGSGHGTLPPAAFNSSITSSCVNCWLAIQFLSQTSGSEAAALTLTTNPQGNPYTLTLTATGLPVSGLLLTPMNQDFGPVPVHSTSAPQIFSLTNLVSPAATVSILSTTVSGDFSVVPSPDGGPACAGELSPGNTCYLGITYLPTTTGSRIGTLTVTTSAGSATSSLIGFGAPDPGLSLQPNALNFHNVSSTDAMQQTAVVTNTSNTTLNLSGFASSDPAFTPATSCVALDPSASCTVTVTFRPASSLVNANLTFNATAVLNGQTITTLYNVPLAGLYTQEGSSLAFFPDVSNFGTLPTGSISTSRTLTLANFTSKNLNLNLTTPREFALTTPTPCPSLAPGASCQIPITYVPSDGGSTTGTLFAQATPSDGSAPLSALAYLQGFATASGSLHITGPALIPHAPINFGAPVSGQTTQQILTLTNNGVSPVTIHRILTDPPFFAATTCGSPLAPNASCTLTLTYAPTYQTATLAPPRNDAGALTILSDAASSPDTFTLAGTVQPAIGSSTNNGPILSVYSLSQGSLTFPNTQPGNASLAQTVTLTNTGSVTLHVLNTIVPADFAAATTCDTVLPGAACTYTVRFQPGLSSTATTRTGTLGILTDSSTALDFITLVGTSAAPQIALSATTLNFGTANVGASTTLPVTVTNNSSFPITLTSVTASGDYTAAYGNCPSTALAAGASCTLQVTFTPTATGTRAGTLSITTDATSVPLTIPLTGTAVQSHLQITPGALSFGAITVGASAQLSLQLLNTGSAPVNTITLTLAGANPSAFAVTTPCTATLAPNQGCAVVLTFTPPAVGAFSATLNIASDDPSSPAGIPLTGTGVAPGSFTLTVNGAASAAVTVASGSPAAYNLTVTPINGFTGTVALTCAPINPGPYAACSLDPSTVTLNGTAPATSTVTISTIAHASLSQPHRAPAYLALLALPLLTLRRRPARALALLLITTLFTACGGHSNSGGGGDNGIHYTPTGAYQYSVTATATNGTQITHTVTLNLNVQ